MGGFGNGEAEEDWRWDLNPGTAAMQHLFGASQFGQRTTDFNFFFWDTVPWTGQRGKKDCVFVGFQGLWDLNEDNKSLLLSLYNFLDK